LSQLLFDPICNIRLFELLVYLRYMYVFQKIFEVCNP